MSKFYDAFLIGPNPGSPTFDLFGERVFVDGNGLVWPVELLKKKTPDLEGKPIFMSHDWNFGSRTRYNEHLEYHIGHVVKARWLESTGQAMGLLKITSARYLAGIEILKELNQLDRFGLSLTCMVNSIPGKDPSFELVRKIGEIKSVDIVRYPATGGRFILD
jgi:hypothetical protein